MRVSPADIEHLDALLKAIGRLRFDVSGTECMQLAVHLAWFGQLRQRLQEEVNCQDADRSSEIAEGLALLKNRKGRGK